jgi:hypothetical protein
VTGTLSDEVLRAAVRTAVQSSSQRTVAEQIGLTHRGLAKFLDGSTPRENTRRKLREWYVREASTRPSLDKATVQAAIGVLLGGLPEGDRARAEAKLLEAVRQSFREAKVDLPSWAEKSGDSKEGS